jgi:hypothetical protein
MSQQSLHNSSDTVDNDLESDDDIKADSVMLYAVDSSRCNYSSYNISISEAYAQLDAGEVESSFLTEFANMDNFMYGLCRGQRRAC